MTDSEFRELTKHLVTIDYKLTLLVTILSQALPNIAEGQSLKEVLDQRTEHFVGPKRNAVTDQVLAEIREAVTDPDLNAWSDATGYEADDKCAWHNLYQIKGISQGGFWVQPEYSNGGSVTRSGFTAKYPGPGCVVPR